MVARTAPEACNKCGSKKINQDEDVLDTWFSSALWPFSTLGWPEQTPDLARYYPTNVLVTGYDIIFFWVVRMVFSGLEMMGEVPYQYVYVHGLVRDAEGRKMSKSLGNGIDPLEVIDQYGVDALRFMLTTGISPGSDLRFKMDRLESCRNFANKLWNASRFVIMNLYDQDGVSQPLADLSNGIQTLALKPEDQWILSKVNDAVAEVTGNMDRFDLALAGQRVYELIWNEYCDWYIELVKPRLYGSDESEKLIVRTVLVKALKDMLSLLHPFMPFITEEIYRHLPETEGMLICAPWPLFQEEMVFTQSVAQMELAMDLIRTIRNIRAEAEAAPSRKLRALIHAEEQQREQIQSCESHVRNLGGLTELVLLTDPTQIPEEVMSGVVERVEVYIPLDDLIDYAAEAQRLEKEKERLEGEVQRIGAKLGNPGFVEKAPAAVVAAEKEKVEKYQDMLQKVMERLAIVSRKR